MAGAFRWVARRAKPYSWRATAAYFWITALASVVGLGGTLDGAEDLLFGRTAQALAAVGFEPANERYLEAVLKVLWVLIITNFRPLGLLGLAAYTLSFPVWLPALFLLNRWFVAYGTEPLGARNIQRREAGRSFPFTAACIVLLGGWFLLYGGSSQWQQVLPGILLSGLLLLALSLRLFLRVRPVRARNAGTFRWLADGGERFLAQNPAVPTKQYRNAGEVEGEMIVLRLIRRWSIRLAAELRRTRTHDIAAALVFADYIASLVIVTGVAIVFWALAIGVASDPPMPMLPASKVSIAYLIPGLGGQAPGAQAPYWTRVGPAVTGWVLFVLYIGPAASVLPERQRAATAELAIARRRFSDVGSGLSRSLRSRARLAASMDEET